MTIFKFDSVTEALPHLLDHVQAAGEEVGSRQGDRTLEILMPQITLVKPWRREVLTPGRKASLPAQIAETMWVLGGRDDIDFLSYYLPRAVDFSDDGETWRGAYGPRIREWETPDQDGHVIDQLAHVVDLLKTDRTTRRAVIAIYDPVLDTAPGKDIPCNNWLSFINRGGELHMNVAIRSNDVFWGWSGINTFEWSALQEIVAHLVGVQVGTLTFNVTSFHLYDRHWKRADEIVKTWKHTAGLDWTHPADSPRFDLGGHTRSVNVLDALIQDWFDTEEKIRTGQVGWEPIVYEFPEPMLRSWLHVIAAHWTGDATWLVPYKGTRLDQGYRFSPKRKVAQAVGATDGSKDPAGYLVVKPGQIFEAGDEIDVYPLYGEVPPDTDTISIDISVDTTRIQEAMAKGAKALSEALASTGISTRGKEKPLEYKTEFVKYVDELHREKSAAYGDSWKKRGEQMAIMANIARKVDRLGGGTTGDETVADTVIDLVLYAIKYERWIQEQWKTADPKGHPSFYTDENDHVRHTLNHLARSTPLHVTAKEIPDRISTINDLFGDLEKIVTTMPITTSAGLNERMGLVTDIRTVAFPAARHLWEQEQTAKTVQEGMVSGVSIAPLTHRQETQRDVDAVKRIDDKTKKANATRMFTGYNDTEEN